MTLIKPSSLFVTDAAEFFRIDASSKLDSTTKHLLGQYMTPAPIGRFMASLFSDLSGEIRILDPGAGVGSLTAAVVEQVCSSPLSAEQVSIVCYEVDQLLSDYLRVTLNNCVEECNVSGISAGYELFAVDFLEGHTNMLQQELFAPGADQKSLFTHVIMNPPYRKIHSHSDQRATLRRSGIEATNLYAGFVLMALELLQLGGEMVVILPRSFCNGPYFKSFRKRFLSSMGIHQIHVFELRDSAFGEDDVLQENVILHAVKGKPPEKIKISTSSDGRFQVSPDSGSWLTEDTTEHMVDHDLVIDPSDPDRMVRIIASDLDRRIAECMLKCSNSLVELGVEVSTGPVVDFRLRDDLRDDPCDDSVPLIYGAHFSNGGLEWPKKMRKPNAIRVTENSRKWLWDNQGYFILTRRMTSKEEPRRVSAKIYSSHLPSELIGFENHLNVFHSRRRGLSKDLAFGLSTYLNSSIVDRFFRQFSGHTQVNASDLRWLPYPDHESLIRLGRRVGSALLTQSEIDKIVHKEIFSMEPEDDPILAHVKIEEAIEILKALGMPRGQQNDRSALTLLALLDVKPFDSWQDASRPLMGITSIMQYAHEHYGRSYAPNTRETFRRQTIHQLMQAGIAAYNPDDPNRPVNSPKTCYQVTESAFEVIIAFRTDRWDTSIEAYLNRHQTLVRRWEMERELQKVPVKLPQGEEIALSPGPHSELIGSLITNFGSRFAPGAEVIYIGDTEHKTAYFDSERLRSLGVKVDLRGKMPDLILYHSDRDWLMLIEAVTSHGPVDSKRHDELAKLFSGVTSGLVFVSGFPDRSVMARYLSAISWETEVWCADAPDHLIHFDGESFLGPYKS